MMWALAVASCAAPYGEPITPREQIALHAAIRRCWFQKGDEFGERPLQVRLILKLDADGAVRTVQVAPGDPAAGTGTPLHAFATRAEQAILDSRCAPLPIPVRLITPQRQFTFVLHG
jgi:hypothetical protein